MAGLSLTIYLLKPSVTDPTSVVRENADLLCHDFHISNLSGVFFARPPDPHPADWLNFVEPIANGVFEDAKISSMGCLVITNVGGRYFALAFGTGWTFLDPHVYERDFGLKVVVNAIDPSQLRVLDARSLDTVALSQRTQTSRKTGLSDFGMNLDRDMLTGVTGSARSTELLGSTITGKDSLKMRRELEWSEVSAILKELLELSESESYRNNSFDWIDHFNVIRDQDLVQDLDEQLQQGIDSGEIEGLHLTVPEVIDWENPIFKYQKRKLGKPHDDVDWETYAASVTESGKTLTVEIMKRQEIHCFIGDSDRPKFSWPIYRCLYAEVVNGPETFVLSNGSWYSVAKDYIDSVDQDVMTIPQCSLDMENKTFSDEDAYIEGICSKDKTIYKQLHRQLITHGGGHGSIEFCDILSHHNHLIHIKRHGPKKGPEPLSHLFSQGVVSSQLMMSDQDFRRKVNAKMAVCGWDPLFVPHTDRLDGRDWEVVFVIIHYRIRTNKSLPLMSRINLRNAASRIRALGMSVSTYHVVETDQVQVEVQV